MARPRKSIPSYLHHPSGKARAVWTDPSGVRQFRLLPGPFDSAESRAAFARLVAELAASPIPAPAANARDGITVNELLVAYLRYADQHYRAPDGIATGETHHVRTVGKFLRRLYGHTPAAAFGPLALKAVRHAFVAAGWCRKTVNQQTERAKRMFRWAASEELVPAAVFQSLATVAGLQKGRSPARESAPFAPSMTPRWSPLCPS